MTPSPTPRTSSYVENTVINTDTVTATVTTTKPTVTSTHVDNNRPNANTVTATSTTSTNPNPNPNPNPNRSDTGNGNGNNNNTVALVGGVVGGCLGVAVLGLIGILLLRRRAAPASQPINRATSTLAFSTDSNHKGGPPVTYAAQPGWHPQQPSRLSLPPGAGPPAAGHFNISSRQSGAPPPPVRMRVEGATMRQGTHGRSASQTHSLSSSPPESPVDPRELYRDAIRGSIAAPMNVPSSAPEPLPYASAYSFVPGKAEVKEGY